MTYDTRENSLQSGEPIELYQFTYGNNIYRFTSAQTAVSAIGYVWQPALLKRSGIDYSAEKSRSNLKLDVSRQFEIADLYRIMPPSEVILLAVYRYHEGDNEVAIIWTGRILAVEFAGSLATITCEPVTTSLKRTGLRRLYQRQCPHVLYGTACGANKASFSAPATLSAVNGTTLNSATFGLYADGYFSGGYLDIVADGVTERRFITAHTGTQIIINVPLIGLVSGDTITVYAGCDHSKPTCKDKFNNLLNYGGFPYIPQKNPFGNNGIY